MTREQQEQLNRGTMFAFTTKEEFLAVQQYYEEEEITMPVGIKGEIHDVPVPGTPHQLHPTLPKVAAALPLRHPARFWILHACARVPAQACMRAVYLNSNSN